LNKVQDCFEWNLFIAKLLYERLHIYNIVINKRILLTIMQIDNAVRITKYLISH